MASHEFTIQGVTTMTTLDNEAPFLAHHGVPNQKWGERKYQNKDGSLTPLGREHRRLTRPSRAKSKSSDSETTKPSLKQIYANKKAEKAKRIADEKKAKEKAAKAAEKKRLEEAAEEERVRSEKEKAGIEVIRQQVFTSKDPKYVFDNLQYLSNEEVAGMAKRLENQANIKKLIPKEKTPLEQFNDKMTAIGNTQKTVQTTVETVSKTLSTFGIDTKEIGKTFTDAVNAEIQRRAQHS